MSGIAERSLMLPELHAQTGGKQRNGAKSNAVWRGAVIPVLLLAAWQITASRGLISTLVLPPPAQVLAALRQLAISGALENGIAVSLQRLALGYGLGVAIGVPLGLLLAISPLARRLIEPSFNAIARVPLLAWIPFLMVLFGIGETLKLVIIAKAALTPITLNTRRAVQSVPPAWLELGRLYRLNRAQTIGRILLPATILPLFVGLRFGLIQAWSALVVVELLASTDGLGFQLTMSRQLFQLDTMIALMAVIGIIGFTLDRGVVLTEAYLVRRFGGGA
jgi:sulfonate transport system permease protein